VAERAKTVKIGDPLDLTSDMGPLATMRQLDNINQIVADSRQQGGEVITGGERPQHLSQGYYYAPTLISCPDQSIASVRNELFGPVISALRFDDEEQAIAYANDSQFGLGAGVFTRDVGRAHRVASKIRSGIVWVNTYRAISPIAPFGGFGQSGYGREAGTDAIYDYTRTRTVWINTSTAPMADPFIMR
jgi:acyl-CoA reductase-like NAD-dependent aldehyde dehydrogenase